MDDGIASKLVLNADKRKLVRFRPHAFSNNFNIYVDGIEKNVAVSRYASHC